MDFRRNLGCAIAAMLKEMVHLCDGQEPLLSGERHLTDSNTANILDLLHVTPRLWQAVHVFYRRRAPRPNSLCVGVC